MNTIKNYSMVTVTNSSGEQTFFKQSGAYYNIKTDKFNWNMLQKISLF